MITKKDVKVGLRVIHNLSKGKGTIVKTYIDMGFRFDIHWDDSVIPSVGYNHRDYQYLTKLSKLERILA